MARTLQNFGVPTEGQTAGDGIGILQPKLSYRFRVIVTGFGGTDVSSSKEFTRQVINVTRPKIDHEPIVIDSYNSRMNMMGKHTWQPITLELRDDIGNQLTKLVGNQLQTQLNHRNQHGPAAGTNYKFGMLVEILDGNSGVPVEQIQLEGCFLSNVDYTQTDYSSSEPVRISMTVHYDNCIFVDEEIMPAADKFTNNSSLLG